MSYVQFCLSALINVKKFQTFEKMKENSTKTQTQYKNMQIRLQNHSNIHKNLHSKNNCQKTETAAQLADWVKNMLEKKLVQLSE